MSRSNEDDHAADATPTQQGRTATIRHLNDQLRRFFAGGRVTVTQGIQALPADTIRKILYAVCRFADFNPDNDPYDEHDFGAVTVGDTRVFWKIDYYDLKLEYGSPDPADPGVTSRVLTIMLAEEY